MADISLSGPIVTAYINGMAVEALIDTGASCSCIRPSVATTLGLKPSGESDVMRAGQKRSLLAPRYVVTLSVPEALSLPWLEMTALEIPGAQALLGRDVLRGCVFSYDGPKGCFTLNAHA